MWSIKYSDMSRAQEITDSKHIGSLMVLRVEEVDSEKVAQINNEMVGFGVVVAIKDKNKLHDLNDNFEKVLEAYDERGRKIYQLENTIANMEKYFGKRKRGRQSS